MPSDTLLDFIVAVEATPELRSALEQATNPEQAAAIANGAGFALSAEELRDFRIGAPLADDFDEQDLDAVIGGVGRSVAVRDRLAIYLPSGTIAPPPNPYGRLIANAGAFRALASHGGYRQIDVLGHQPLSSQALQREFLPNGSSGCAITVGSVLNSGIAAQTGMLLSGQPYLSDLAWIRQQAGHGQAYSIVGSIFAFASPVHREKMLASLLAPLQEWDALICTSPSLHAAVVANLDDWEDDLRQRLGLQRLTRPQLPMIPLGVDAERLAAQGGDAEARRRFRQSHAIEDGDVMVFHLGRLSCFDKAFPQAMLRALQAAAQVSAAERPNLRLHFVMAGWFPLGQDDETRYRDAARLCAPDVNVLILDGNDPDLVAECWAGADIFLLLSDTILETFGQAPLEAMAAGVPVVLSDWDGYRLIVRDGIDGFLIPTLGPGPVPQGSMLANLEALEILDWPFYMGSVAQHMAVHIGRTTEALLQLIRSPSLRTAMGTAGRRRAQEQFDWSRIVSQYLELFDHLSERRRHGAAAADALVARRQRRPLRGDPFHDFAHFATATLDPQLMVRRVLTTPSGTDQPSVALDHFFQGLRGTGQENGALLDLLADGADHSVEQLLASFPESRRHQLWLSLVWLAKLGQIDWLPAA